MTDSESMASPNADEGVSAVRPKSTDAVAVGDAPVGHSETSDAPRNQRQNTGRKPTPQHNPSTNAQDNQQRRSHNGGNRPRAHGDTRNQQQNQNQNERNVARSNGNVPEDVAATRELRTKLREKFGRQGLNSFNSYLRNRLQLARFKTTSEFLNRCDVLSIIPAQYKLSNSQVQNTMYIKRLLERFSRQLMKAELRHSQKRCSQIERLLESRVETLKQLYDEELFNEVVALADKVQQRRYDEFLKSSNETYQSLIEEYKIPAEEAAEAEATVVRNEEARRQRRAYADQHPNLQSSEASDAGGSSNEARTTFRRGPRRQNGWRPKPFTRDV